MTQTLTGKARLSQPHRNILLACVSPKQLPAFDRCLPIVFMAQAN
jgi:hypothetical protein